MSRPLATRASIVTRSQRSRIGPPRPRPSAFHPFVGQGRSPCRDRAVTPPAMATASRAATNKMECTRMSAEMVSHDEIKTFFEDGWIEAVLFTVKSGKEATVYCCKACPGRGDPY